MKIRRFVAKDMRTALAEIKEELGPDAVIMSNKKTAQGVELMAAVDYGVATPEPKQEQARQAYQAPNAMAGIPSVEAQPQASQTAQNWAGFESQTASNSALQNSQPHNEQAPADSLQALLQRQNQQSQQPPQANASAASMQQTPAHSLQGAGGSIAEIQQAIAGEQEQLNLSQELIDFSARLAQAQTPEQFGGQAINSQRQAQQTQIPQQNAQQVFAERTQTQAQSQPQSQSSMAQPFNNVNSIDGQAGQQQTPPFVAEQAADMVNHQQQSAVANNNSDAELSQMRNEMSYMRKLLEEQVSGLMWQDMARKEPMRAMLVKRLMNLGLTETVADQLACFIPEDLSEKEAWEQVKEMLAGQINTTNNDIIHRGGVVALVGPTGVGKTTTIAKLAARFSQIHGADQLALISADSYRIAGHEQLATYGKIIGCPVKLAKNAQELNELLVQFQHKKLVLIDTAGMGQRDLRLAEQLAQLVQSSHVKIRNYLVLAANAQQRVLQDSVERFKKVPLSGCVFTKVDETLSVGEIIATSIQNCLPIGYLTDGQRVPEDIRVANAANLVTMAEQLAEDKPKSYDWMPEAQAQNVV